MKFLYFLILSQVGACSAGCAGYATAAELERSEMGPDACEKRCQELDMRMGALALIDASHAGCVCVPTDPQSGPTAQVQQSAVIASTGMLIAEEERRRQSSNSSTQPTSSGR